MKHAVLWITGLVMIAGSMAYTAVPQKVSYQGVLANASGGAVPNGNYNLTLSLYDTLSGGTAVWSEAQLVNVSNGIFNVILGSVTPINVAFDRPLYLGVSVGGGAELAPRTLLTASPYSLNSPLMAFGGSGYTTTIGTDWTNYEHDSVTIHVPGPGYIVVRSTAWLQLNHAQGTDDRVYVAHDSLPNAYSRDYAFVSTFKIGADEPTVFKDVTLPVQTTFAVYAAGTYTYYLIAKMYLGQDVADHFWYANTTAEWYPASSPQVPPLLRSQSFPAEKSR